MARSVFTVLDKLLSGNKQPPEPKAHAALIEAVYEGLYARQPDAHGFEAQMRRLQSGEVTWSEYLWDAVNSSEFRHAYARRRLADTLHEARVELFANHLPPAKRVVDLGGASEGTAEGGLFALGYPYAPRRLTIVDLPPEDRFTRHDPHETPSGSVAQRGTHIEYKYGSMADLGFLQDGSVDLVVSGESIEHVTEEDGRAVCREAFRVLEPGGHFCLDTPNRLLTALHSPDAMIHPEHKKEYTPAQLRQALLEHGFEIVKELGLCPMPRSLQQGKFLWEEVFGTGRLCARADEGYLFYLHARKPA